MFSFFLRAPLAGLLAYFLVLVIEASILKGVDPSQQKSWIFIFFPALIEEALKIGFIKKITEPAGNILPVIILVCLSFGLAEAFFSSEKTIFEFVRLPFVHLVFTGFGFLTIELASRAKKKIGTLFNLIIWILASSLLHWAFNLAILNFNRPF